MTANLRAGSKATWKGIIIAIERVDGGIAAVHPEGSSHVFFVGVDELAPIPRKEETLNRVMQISDRDWKRAVDIADAFNGVLEAGRGKRTADVCAIGERFKICGRAAYNLFKRYRQDPSPFSLLRGKPGPTLGSKVLEIAREKLIDTNIEEHYLTPECPTVESLYGRIKIACEKANLPPPCRVTIRKRIKAKDLRDRLKAREGRKKADETTDPAWGHLNVQRPLERIEIDHTLADVILISATKKRVVLGRPWVTFLIDCFTRLILGFYVSFERPSSKSVALCLAHAILPKTEWLRVHGIPGTWPAFGFPESIFLDNALEFRAVALRRGCEAFRIKLCYRPPGVPQVGGSIERLIGTMMGKIHLLPGTTQANVQKRGEYDAEGRAQLTLRQFVAWLTSEIVTQYHTMTHRGIGKPPLVAWNEAFEGVDRKEPGAPLEILANFLPATTRVLHRTGVHVNRSNYWSDAFAPWVGHKKSVTVHEYPLDPESIFVRLPNGELTQARVSGGRPLEGKTVLDHLLQAQEDSQLEAAPELKQIRHEGRARCDAIVQEAKHRAKHMPEPRTRPAPQGLKLFRPAKAPLKVYSIDD